MIVPQYEVGYRATWHKSDTSANRVDARELSTECATVARPGRAFAPAWFVSAVLSVRRALLG